MSASNYSLGDAAIIRSGGLRRLVDSAEYIASNYKGLVLSKTLTEESRDNWRKLAEHKERQLRSLRGQITKLNKRLMRKGKQ